MRRCRVAGHFGEWLQGRLGPDGPVVLVTLPCVDLGVTAEIQQGPCSFDAGEPQVLVPEMAEAMWHALGVARPNGRITVRPDMPPGGGAGASTAALLALAGLAVEASPEDLARACLAAEAAVDPLMLSDPGNCLWASREARVVRSFAALPEFEIVGGFWGPPLRTDAADGDFADISDLIEPWAEAALRQDRAALAGIATHAAELTTALRGPEDDPIRDIAEELGALGFCRAHTGSARGLIYRPGTVPDFAKSTLEEAEYGDILQFRTGRS